MDNEKTPQEKEAKKPHDAFFRWLFSDVIHLRHLLELSGKVNVDVGEFLTAVNLDTLVRIPDSYSEVEETGDADLAFRVNVSTGAPVLVAEVLRGPYIFVVDVEFVAGLEVGGKGMDGGT